MNTKTAIAAIVTVGAILLAVILLPARQPAAVEHEAVAEQQTNSTATPKKAPSP